MAPTSSSRSSRSRALRTRDAGLRRISVVTRVFVVGSVAAAGAFTALAAWAQPGRAKTATVPGSAAGGRVGRLVAPTTGASPTGTAPSGPSPATTPVTSPATTPATTAPANYGGSGNAGTNSGGYVSPPATLPDPGYQYTGPAVVSGAS